MQEEVQLPAELLSKVQPWHAREIAKSKSLSKMALRVFRKGGSPQTVGNYAKDVLGFCKWLEREPDQALSKKHDWPKVVNEYLDFYVVKKGNAKTSSRTVVAAVKKWLETNEVLSTKSLAWQGVDIPKYIRSEVDQIPKKQELRIALSGGRIRDRAMVLMAISSGLRRGSLLALRFKDIDLEREVPMIKPRPETTKGRARFFTFMSPEAKEALQLYRREREMRGESITPESYVFTVDRPRGAPYMSGVQASARWIEVLKKAGLAEKGSKNYKMHFHVLRKFYKSWASLSGVNGEVIEYTMGHRSSLPQVYFIGNAEDVPDEVVKKLETEYRKAIPALTVMSDEGKVKELEDRIVEETRKYETKLAKLEEKEEARASAEVLVVELVKNGEMQQKQIRQLMLQVAELRAKQQKS